ncbi:putative bulb-type lectin domain-containing protein [Helianthus annuus]|uniref:Bulb-type lectin domain-containing protein n=1 Tax=Helianthus annuus TaxID=4232 RepID=A0A9K3DSZ2_HELAN|nr:putative bulb-type lectin domain-containing protein [Helianthus annuus]
MSNNPVVVVQLLDTGNLIVWDRSTKNERVIWQSFDHPGNTFLPGMKFGKDLVTGRYGPWNGLKFQGLRMKNPNPIYSVQFVPWY